jgi:hypothetical protein
METLPTATLPQDLPYLPDEVRPIFERFITCEYTSLTAHDTPITYPVTPYLGADGSTLDVSTGLAYPAKAERARRNPKVALLYSDPTGSGLIRPPVVLVQGYAAVRDADLQANTDRYVRLALAKLPAIYRGTPRFALRKMAWYFARIWIQVTPVRVLWWPEGRLDQQPERWEAPEGAVPRSDPAPAGKALGAWKAGADDWRRGAAYAVQKLGAPILTLVDSEGFPASIRVRATALERDGVRVEVPGGSPVEVAGPACLTFHTHGETFTGQQNVVFVGHVRHDTVGYLVVVERQLGDWSMAGSRLQATWSFLQNGRRLAPRLALEAQRRGQLVPLVRLPGEY